MIIEYFHGSKWGNGARVAEEFKRVMAGKGVTVNVHHIREVKPTEIAPVDFYVFSAPGRMGRPLGSVQRFMKKAKLPQGSKYAIMTTEGKPRPDKKTGEMPTEEEMARWQRMRPIMTKILQDRGFVKVTESRVYVNNMKGPLDEGWEKVVEAFAAQIPV